MHFSITAAFGGRLATLLMLSSLRPRLDTCHFWLLSSSRARLNVLPQALPESACIGLPTAACSVTAGTSSPSNADTRRAKLASVSKGAQRAALGSMALLHAPNAAPFWNKLGFERQPQPCSISEACDSENFAPTYQCWLHSGHHQLGRFHLGVGAYGLQIGVHKCGERPAAVFWALRSLSSSSTVINWPGS